MTKTPHDAAMEAATKAFGHGVLDNIGRDNSIDEEVDCLLVAIQAYLRSLCTDARVVEAIAKVNSGAPYPSKLSMNKAKRALSALCEMGGGK